MPPRPVRRPPDGLAFTTSTSHIQVAPAPLVSPGFIAPMMPTLVDEPPTTDGWIHEVKHDGYRTILGVDGGATRAFTRNGHDWTKRYLPIVATPCGCSACRVEALLTHLTLDDVARHVCLGGCGRQPSTQAVAALLDVLPRSRTSPSFSSPERQCCMLTPMKSRALISSCADCKCWRPGNRVL